MSGGIHMEKILYLMRHGQTLFNVEHKIQGWCDSPLTPLGIAQAKVARQYFDEHHIIFDHCYASTSERACDTLEIVTHHKYPYTRLKGLKEWNFGKFEGMDEFLNPPRPYDDFFVKYGGENQEQLQQRLVSTLTKTMEQDDHYSVLAVSHGAACANFIRYFNDYNQKQYKPGIKNCTIFKMRYEDGRFSCIDIIEPDFSKLEDMIDK